MNDLYLALLSITLLFFLFLIIKEILNKDLKEKFCVICAAVTLTWIILLILYWFNIFKNEIIIALLMGQTSLGIFYYIEFKVNNELKIFGLPFLLTLTFIAYIIINPYQITNALILLVILWLFFILIYFYKSNSKINKIIKKLIECCKKW